MVIKKTLSLEASSLILFDSNVFLSLMLAKFMASSSSVAGYPLLRKCPLRTRLCLVKSSSFEQMRLMRRNWL